MVVFDRPVGAAPDSKEIEYIAALHQSGTRIRPNGSIKDEDIKIYLRSRFGIEVTLEQVRSTIMHGMGGGDAPDEEEGELDENRPSEKEGVHSGMNVASGDAVDAADGKKSNGEEAVLDLMELMAILFIPLLMKADIVEGGAEVENKGAQGEDTEDNGLPPGVLAPPKRLLGDMVDIILHDATGSQEPSLLTAALIRDIFLMYGETSLAQDPKLIEEMLEAATGRPVDSEGATTFFNVQSFGHALTNDVQLYDLRNETRQSSIVQDIFGDNRVRVAEEKLEKEKRAQKKKRKASKTDGRVVQSAEEAHLKQTISTLKGARVVDIKDIERIFTAPAIDITAGTYRSKALIVCLWGSTLFALFLLVFQLQQGEGSGCSDLYIQDGTFKENAGGVFCDVSFSILNWVIRFAAFCFLGLLIMGLGSLGNFVGNTRWYLPLIAMVAVTFLAYSYEIFDGDPSQGYSFLFFMTIMCTVLGTIAIYLHATHLFSLCFKNVDFSKSPWLQYIGFGALKQELHIKQAAAFKLNHLATNARDIHYRQSTTDVFKTYFGHGLSAYVLHGTEYVRMGGITWFYKRLRDQTLFKEEGMWYSARLVASNMSQLFMCIFILLLGVFSMRTVIDNYGQEKAKAQLDFVLGQVFDRFIDEERIAEAGLTVFNYVATYIASFNTAGILSFNCSDFFGPDNGSICEIDIYGFYNCSNLESAAEALCALVENPDLGVLDPALQASLLQSTGFAVSEIYDLIRANLSSALNSASESLYPESIWMLTVPIGFGIAVAVINTLFLYISYLPSVTATIIEFRTGVIPSLKDRGFEKYRVAPDTVTLLTGSLFWGALVSSVLFGSVVALIVFLFLWQGSRKLIQRLVTIGIGLAVIIIIRMSCVACCKVAFFKGLYRSRPAGANIALMSLEWANYIFTTAFILVRMFKLILTATSQIGKIDRPFLAKGVGNLGPLELDPYPTIHNRDLVAHEAHRHPYIEVLGLMYLMKLRYADAFCTRAGSAWRLIFVYALMPWFHQYRIHEDDILMDDGEEVKAQTEFATVLDEQSKSLRSQQSLGLVSLSSTRQSNSSHLVDLHGNDEPVGSSTGAAQTLNQMEAENERLKAKLERMQKKLDRTKKQLKGVEGGVNRKSLSSSSEDDDA